MLKYSFEICFEIPASSSSCATFACRLISSVVIERKVCLTTQKGVRLRCHFYLLWKDGRWKEVPWLVLGRGITRYSWRFHCVWRQSVGHLTSSANEGEDSASMRAKWPTLPIFQVDDPQSSAALPSSAPPPLVLPQSGIIPPSIYN